MNKILLLIIIAASTGTSQWEIKTTGLPSNFMGFSIDANENSTAIISIVPQTTRFNTSSLFKTANGGNNWVQLPSPAGELIVDVELVNEKIWGATDWGRIIFSGDGGETWMAQFVDSSITEFMNYIEMFDENNGVAMGDVYAGHSTNNSWPALFLKTTNGGQNWVSVNDSTFGGLSGDTWRRLDFVSASVGYFRESGVNPGLIYKTTDGCVSWTQLPLNTYPTVIKFYDENIGLTSNTGNTISRTINGGLTWETFPSPINWGNDFEFQPEIPRSIWAVDADYIYFSSNMGQNWITETVPVGQLIGRYLIFTSQLNLWLLCDGVVLRNSNVNTVLSNRAAAEIPSAFNLKQNYPNPFNSTTKIKFTIPSFALRKSISEVGVSAILKVYDVLGREITTLINKELSPGNYEVGFDGRILASGVYIYRLEAESFTQTQKNDFIAMIMTLNVKLLPKNLKVLL